MKKTNYFTLGLCALLASGAMNYIADSINK